MESGESLAYVCVCVLWEGGGVVARLQGLLMQLKTASASCEGNEQDETLVSSRGYWDPLPEDHLFSHLLL